MEDNLQERPVKDILRPADNKDNLLNQRPRD